MDRRSDIGGVRIEEVNEACWIQPADADINPNRER
jgi:hypothetical protein